MQIIYVGGLFAMSSFHCAVLLHGAEFTISHGTGLHEVTAGFGKRYLGFQDLTLRGFVDLFASFALIFLILQVVARARVLRQGPEPPDYN